jgi:hypothetical protein
MDAGLEEILVFVHGLTFRDICDSRRSAAMVNPSQLWDFDDAAVAHNRRLDGALHLSYALLAVTKLPANLTMIL